MSAREVATWTGVTVERVRQLARSGELAATQHDGQWWFQRPSVEARWPHLAGQTPPRLRLVKGGPQTPSGKAASSLNAIRHAAYARDVVVQSGKLREDAADFDALVADHIEHFQPRTPLEERKIRDVAEVEWRRRRLRNAARIALEIEGADVPEHPVPDMRQELGTRCERLCAAATDMDDAGFAFWNADADRLLATAKQVGNGEQVAVLERYRLGLKLLGERWQMAASRAEFWSEARPVIVGTLIVWAHAVLAELQGWIPEARPPPPMPPSVPFLEWRQPRLDQHEAHLANMVRRLLGEFTALRELRT